MHGAQRPGLCWGAHSGSCGFLGGWTSRVMYGGRCYTPIPLPRDRRQCSTWVGKSGTLLSAQRARLAWRLPTSAQVLGPGHLCENGHFTPMAHPPGAIPEKQKGAGWRNRTVPVLTWATPWGSGASSPGEAVQVGTFLSG